MFEKDLVAVAAAIQTKKQNHGTMGHRGQKDWAGRKCRRRPEKLALRCLFVRRGSIAQHPDNKTGIETFFHPQ